MSRARMRLILTAALFCAWIGWLAYLAVTTTRPVVLSRAQFLASQLDVVAVIAEREGVPLAEVKVEQVLWPPGIAMQKLAGQMIKVVNLPQLTKEDGFAGPGEYVLPLIAEGNEYRVASIPRSPGLSEQMARPRIYRATSQALEQHRRIRSGAD